MTLTFHLLIPFCSTLHNYQQHVQINSDYDHDKWPESGFLVIFGVIMTLSFDLLTSKSNWFVKQISDYSSYTKQNSKEKQRQMLVKLDALPITIIIINNSILLPVGYSEA